MLGNNTLTLNEASVIEAVQLLLDRDAPGAGKVTAVKPGSSSANEFVITLVKESAPG